MSSVDGRPCARKWCSARVCSCEDCSVCWERCSEKEAGFSPLENETGVWVGPHCLKCDRAMEDQFFAGFNAQSSSTDSSPASSAPSHVTDDGRFDDFFAAAESFQSFQLCNCDTCTFSFDGAMYVAGSCIWVHAADAAEASAGLAQEWQRPLCMDGAQTPDIMTQIQYLDDRQKERHALDRAQARRAHYDRAGLAAM